MKNLIKFIVNFTIFIYFTFLSCKTWQKYQKSSKFKWIPLNSFEFLRIRWNSYELLTIPMNQSESKATMTLQRHFIARHSCNGEFLWSECMLLHADNATQFGSWSLITQRSHVSRFNQVFLFLFHLFHVDR